MTAEQLDLLAPLRTFVMDLFLTTTHKDYQRLIKLGTFELDDKSAWEVYEATPALNPPGPSRKAYHMRWKCRHCGKAPADSQHWPGGKCPCKEGVA